MSTALSPMVSEFDTEEAAASYDVWFRQQVAASLNDPSPGLTHDAAMSQVRQVIANKQLQHATRYLAT